MTMILTFFSSVIIARGLGPEFRGEWASISLFITMISAFTLLGMGDSYLFHKRKFYINNNVSIIIKTSIIIGAVFNMVFFYFYSENIDSENSITIFLMLLLTGGVGLTSSISRIDSDLLVFNKSKVLVALVNTILVLILFSFEILNLSNLLFISVICLLVQLLYTVCFSTVKQFSGTDVINNIGWSGFFKYGIKIHMTSVLGMLINNFDKIYLFFNAKSVDFGIYAVAYGFSRLIGILPNTISSVLYAKFAGGDEGETSEVTSLIFSFLFIPLLLCSLLGSLLCYYFIPMIYGSAYSDAVIPIGILLFECVISGLGWILAQRFNAAGKPGLVFIRQLVAIIPLVFLIFYMPDYEITIVLSLAMLLASIIRLFVTLYMYKNILNENVPRFFPTFCQINKLYNRFKI
ncbi:hypothetical protein [Aliivibrio fischeri]|uniref:hypothetical protein n=1 Tax=Aliivibrio fischeri TaxID=668 RepID=UPI001F3C5046|nr:hypothetical protein [Aliivibrio fischeri]MCE7536793.1 hypothetical protein [Aliivibrio fischeri]MCE7560491.1 hypothetical protein [Aliivibrio fischeri]